MLSPGSGGKPYLMKSPNDFEKYTYSKRSHISELQSFADELFKEKTNFYLSDLKRYQDAFVAMFIGKFITTSSRLLEVGGGYSRILQAFHKDYECWNIDPFEGLGDGPTFVGKMPYKLVLDYMGNFNKELPDNYFDFVFSISALEHVPDENGTVKLVLDDIQRVLKPGGFSLHLLDAVLINEQIHYHKFITMSYAQYETFGKLPDSNKIITDPDLFFMAKEAYDLHWKQYTNTEYEAFGKPLNISILWKKSG
jgi:SAM-dependent methyltransferase